MKTALVFFSFFNIFSKISCQFELPDEFKDVKDAIESKYYEETMEHILKDQQIPVLTRGARIAGGEKAVIGQFPYQALLYLKDDENKIFICGGVLIRYNLVLTAAHCIEGFNEVDVFLGVIDRLNGPAAWHSNTITDKKYLIIHPDFDHKLLRNDIGLIILQDAPEDLLSHEHIDIIDIPTFNEGTIDLEGLESTLSGFGLTEAGTTSKELKYAKLSIISNEECYETFPAYIVSSNLCVATSIRASPCQGDSGGPLTVEITPGRRIVVGLTSFGSKFGCTMNYPVGFQRVANHLIWLDDYLSNSFETTSQHEKSTTTDGSSNLSINFIIMLSILARFLSNTSLF